MYKIKNNPPIVFVRNAIELYLERAEAELKDREKDPKGSIYPFILHMQEAESGLELLIDLFSNEQSSSIEGDIEILTRQIAQMWENGLPYYSDDDMKVHNPIERAKYWRVQSTHFHPHKGVGGGICYGYHPDPIY